MNRTAAANGPAVAPAVEAQARSVPMPRTKYPEIFGMLAREFRPEHIKVRTQAGRQMPYITARTVMNRLDFALGPENWWDEYKAGEHSVECRLTIRLPDGQTLTKSDAGGMAGMSDPGDDDKSGYSDAFKRAAVKFGVGRHLYNDGVVSYPRPEPSPRPQPTDAPASLVEPPAANPEAPTEPAPQPAPSEVRAWIQARIDECNNEWAMTCGEEKKDYKPLCNLHQCVNGIITKWLEVGMVSPAQVNNAEGKRDKQKVAEMLRSAWEDDREATMEDVDTYLRSKQEEAAKAAGINMDAEPVEATP